MLIFVAVSMFAIVGFVTLSLDWGRVALVRTELIHATGTAARAALIESANGGAAAVNAAITYGGLNKVDSSPLAVLAGDVTLGTWEASTRSFTANTATPNAVRVVGVRSTARGNPICMVFGGLFGMPTHDLTYTAIAINGRDLQVDISAQFNTDAMTADGGSFSWGGGLDNSGYSLSDTQLAGRVTRGDTLYALGRGPADAIRCAGQTLGLPAGKYKSVVVLAQQAFGPATSTLTLNNRDGTKTYYAQSYRDWCFSSSAATNETVCAVQGYRNTFSGGRDVRPIYLTSYEFPIVSPAGVLSITLPVDNRLVILAVGLTPAEAITVK